MDQIVFLSSPNPYADALTSNVIVFGDSAFEEVMEVKQGHKGGALAIPCFQFPVSRPMTPLSVLTI